MILSRRFALAAIAAVSLASLSVLPARADGIVTIAPPSGQAPPSGSGLETAVLAGGCFWGIQAVYQHVNGVTNAVSGYAGGTVKNPDYETVSSGTTGHAESVKITFDPRVVSYGKILQVFFSIAHNPTTLDRQGPDEGTQYRSEIFPQSEAQATIARDYIAQLGASHAFKYPIVTKIGTVGTPFYPAESYHQDYATLHPYAPYIVFNDAPKIANLKKAFPELWRDKPVTVAAAGGVGG
jgi:peptide-methionine (S)-S-oxide reductase